MAAKKYRRQFTMTTKSNPKLSIRIAAVLFAILLAGLVLEAMARVAYAFNDEILMSSWVPAPLIGSLKLDPYEEAVPGAGFHWRLKAGFSSSANDVILSKEDQGKTLGARAFKTDIDGTGELFQINQDGFRGPELMQRQQCCRILMLGDSVTFGLVHSTYPAFVEQQLKERGKKVEVVNGGVEGYAVRNIQFELNRYLSIQPDVVTVLIGWNDIFSRSPFEGGWEYYLRSVWLFKKCWRAIEILFVGAERMAERQYEKPKLPIASSDEVREIENYSPPVVETLITLLKKFKDAGIAVYPMTLPGLFVTDVMPSEKALMNGHLPTYTSNPYVLAKVTERFNSLLRFRANENGFEIIDLDAWSREAFQPRDDFFSDSVHLNVKGLQLMGKFIASRLATLGMENNVKQ